MTRKESRATRALKLALSFRDGNECGKCSKPGYPFDEEGFQVKVRVRERKYVMLDLHHIDNLSSNNKLSNLTLLCRPCNVKDGKENKRSGKSVCVREKSSDSVDCSEASPEMQRNEKIEVPYRNWVMGLILRSERKEMLKVTALHGGAEEFECSSVTLARYLKKMTSAYGQLYECTDHFRHRVIRLKKK